MDNNPFEEVDKCPRCGGTNLVIETQGGFDGWVFCDDCDLWWFEI